VCGKGEYGGNRADMRGSVSISGVSYDCVSMGAAGGSYGGGIAIVLYGSSGTSWTGLVNVFSGSGAAGWV